MIRIQLRILPGDITIARIEGEVDLGNAATMCEELSAAMTSDSSGLALDLADTTYVDSVGVRMLFDIRRMLSDGRRTLALVVPLDSPLRRLLRITGFDNIYATLDEAKAEIRARGR